MGKDEELRYESSSFSSGDQGNVKGGAKRLPAVEMGHMVLPAEPIGTVAHAC